MKMKQSYQIETGEWKIPAVMEKKKSEIVKKQNKRPSNKTLPAMLKRNVECWILLHIKYKTYETKETKSYENVDNNWSAHQLDMNDTKDWDDARLIETTIM